MYVWMSGGRTHTIVFACPSASATQPPICTHACVQCMRSACVAPCLRIRPQASGRRGVSSSPEPFPSLLFAFSSPSQAAQASNQLQHHDLALCLSEPGPSWLCLRPNLSQLTPPRATMCVRARGQLPRHRHNQLNYNRQTTQNTHFYFIQYMPFLGNLFFLASSCSFVVGFGFGQLEELLDMYCRLV